MNPAALAAVQSRLGHTFTRPELLIEALTHPGFLNENPGAGPHNQRLEFLGDAVLQLILTTELFARFPADAEGELSRRRASLANGRCLATLAQELGLDQALRLGGSENTPEGRARSSNLEDAFEAVLGALLLDAGLETTRARVLAVYGSFEARLAARLGADNPKGRLQEQVQPRYGTACLRYETVQSGGADHAKEYTSRVYLADRLLGEGGGSSKKIAEEAAARVALETLSQS
jgi:ribonuclease-3